MDYGARDPDRKRFQILLTKEQKVMLDWLSKRRDISKTAVMREALRRMHETERVAMIRQAEARVS